jgi:cytidylate kinase
MIKRKNILKVAIDSPAAAGAGTQAKLIAKHYNLLHLDTGRIYRYVANIKISDPSKYNYKYIKKKIDNLKIKDLQNKKLSSDKVATIASIIAKDKKIRKLVHAFQVKCAYNPPRRYDGSCLDGRDIGSKVVVNADVKFYITANVIVRAMRRYKELKAKMLKYPFKRYLKVSKIEIKVIKIEKYRPL